MLSESIKILYKNMILFFKNILSKLKKKSLKSLNAFSKKIKN